jgi:hypothetical protein
MFRPCYHDLIPPTLGVAVLYKHTRLTRLDETDAPIYTALGTAVDGMTST